MAIRFVRELSRRRVIRGGATYIVIAWAALQVVTLATDPYDPLRRLALYLAIGLFPLALLFSWVFRVVPGSVGQELHEAAPPPRTSHGRALDMIVVAGLAVIVIAEIARRLM